MITYDHLNVPSAKAPERPDDFQNPFSFQWDEEQILVC